MSSSNGLNRLLAITGVATAISAAGYALYFDYQRRNSPEFRKALKRKLRKQRREEQLANENAKQGKLQDIREFLKAELARNPIPTDPSQVEQVFSTNVELGERLSAQPGGEMEAAAKFYKALAVYPKPTDLLGIYQRTIPENIYEMIVLMIAVMPPTNITDFISGGLGGVDSLGIDEDDDQPLISEIVEEEEVDIDEGDDDEGIVNSDENAASAAAEEEMDAEIDIVNDAAAETEEMADRIIDEFTEEVEAAEPQQEEDEEEEEETATESI